MTRTPAPAPRSKKQIEREHRAAVERAQTSGWDRAAQRAIAALGKVSR